MILQTELWAFELSNGERFIIAASDMEDAVITARVIAKAARQVIVESGQYPTDAPVYSHTYCLHKTVTDCDPDDMI